jgi:hypothetical protein
MTTAAAHAVGERAFTKEKTKSDVSPPGTPTCDRHNKKQKLKPGAGSKDFTKTGRFNHKEGTPILDLFPTVLIKKY